MSIDASSIEELVRLLGVPRCRAFIDVRKAGVGMIAATPGVGAALGDPKSDGFKPLTGAQIRDAFAGHTFSDNTHFALRYLVDGTVERAGPSRKVTGKWEVRENALCVTDSAGELCYAVWKKGPTVKLAFGASDLVLDGFVR